MADPAITCEGVWKNYRRYHHRSDTLKEKILARRNHFDEYWVLKDIDLEVPAGATLGIIGANGSGKSTLLKTIAGILTPNRGSVRVNGFLSSLLELGIGFHPDLTGRENVYLSGSLLGMGKSDIDTRYDDMIEFAGIQDFMDTAVKNYSTGMYARLAFALAVSVDPDILLVDEVLSVGDESFQMRCFERIADFRAQGGTIVLVSHSMEAIRSLCQDAIWIHDGLVRESGRSHDVAAKYLQEVYGHPPDGGSTSQEGSRFGSGEASVTDVALLDSTGAPAATFRTGENLTIRLEYRAEVPLEDVACSVAVYRADNLAHLFGQSTRQAGVPLRIVDSGIIEFEIASLPLLQGNYVVSVGLHDALGSKAYDWHERRYSFLVFENTDLTPGAGTIHIDSTWRTRPAHAEV